MILTSRNLQIKWNTAIKRNQSMNVNMLVKSERKSGESITSVVLQLLMWTKYYNFDFFIHVFLKTKISYSYHSYFWFISVIEILKDPTDAHILKYANVKCIEGEGWNLIEWLIIHDLFLCLSDFRMIDLISVWTHYASKKNGKKRKRKKKKSSWKLRKRKKLDV